MIISVKTPDETERTAALAKEIWMEYYTPLIGGEQVAYMLEQFQSAEAIRNAYEKEGYRYYLASEDGNDAGYCGVRPEDGSLFLSKLYVKKDYRGRGVAKRLLKHALADHQKNNIRRVWLTVNKGNSNSIAAYQKMGFLIKEAIVTDIGNGFAMDDYVMELLTERC